ncbi:MAG: hypothetical protein JKX91_02390 [Rhizobiaceae bacterium]|nr:hypothetical protein [Rhizobiaceae bacterium]
MGYKIFTLCLRQLWNNLRVAFQLSWFWILAYFAIIVGFVLLGGATPQNSAGASPPSILMVPFVIIMIVVSIVSFTTIAIGWHRLVLREEMPNSFYVLRREWQIGRYFWNTIKIGFAILIMMIPAFFIVLYPLLTTIDLSIFDAPAPGFSKAFLIQIALQLLFGVIATWLFLRIGTVLPALAIEKRMPLRESFRLTSPISSQLVITAFCIVLLQLVPALVPVVLYPITGPESLVLIGITLVVSIIFGFISFFVGFGILTVVYGHLAEGKPI